MYGIQQKTPKVVHRFIYNNAIRERMKDEEENNVFQHLTINGNFWIIHCLIYFSNI